MGSHWEERLIAYRVKRNFNPQRYLQAKIGLIAKYLNEKRIQHIVLGLSGGVDSVLACAMCRLLVDAKVLVKYTPVVVTSNEGGTNQTSINEYANSALKLLRKTPHYLNLSDSMNDLITQCDINSQFGKGQLLPILRTAAISAFAFSRDNQPYRTVTAGTINRDEGAYIGFYGKQSDGAVDLQLISDLHKSEIKLLLEFLGFPPEIINRTPRGDVVTGLTDEEMIGAPYDFIELIADIQNNQNSYLLSEGLNDPDFVRYCQNIGREHKRNLHKYESGMTGLHFDVMHRYVKNGWSSDNTSNYTGTT
jgi:NAD+ synthetase